MKCHDYHHRQVVLMASENNTDN